MKMKSRNMHTYFLYLLLITSTSAYIDEVALKSLQTLDHWNTFRIAITHTVEECFYVETKVNDTLHVIYQVLKGGNSHIQATITNPSGIISFSQSNASFGWYDEENLKFPGNYRLCFKNEQYFVTKLVYIGVLAVHTDRLSEANINSAEQKALNESIILDEFSTNAINSFSSISNILYRITAHQMLARAHHTHDVYLADANARYVQNWAICQILMMLLCSFIQVFSIRRLFKSSTSNKASSSYGKYTPTYTSESPSYFTVATS